MTISRASLLDEIKDDRKLIPAGKLAYFQERQRNRLYDFLVSKFLEKEKTGHFTRAHLARRIRKSPEQITRWLSTPSNWTLDTISDLALGICGGEIDFSIVVLEEGQRNMQHADGSYVNEVQQAQWYGFHDGWYAVMKRLAGPINLLIGFARSGNEVETDDAPFNAWLSGLDEYAEKAAAAWDALMLPEPPTAIRGDI